MDARRIHDADQAAAANATAERVLRRMRRARGAFMAQAGSMYLPADDSETSRRPGRYVIWALCDACEERNARTGE